MAFPNDVKETDECISYDDKVFESLKFQNRNKNANQLLTSENKSAESSFYEQLQNVKEENEKEVQKLRCKLLEELDNLHSQEQKIHQEMELEKKELKKERDKLLVEIQKLGEKELLLGKEYENRFQKQLREMKLEFASKDHDKNREFESLQNKLAEKEQRLTEILSELTSQKEKHNLLKTEIDELKHMLKTTQGKYSSLLDENTNLLKKFEGMSDYDILKAELSAKSKEISYLQHELAEVHKSAELEKQTYIKTLRILEDKIQSQ
ncbi:Laminin subunit alpha-2, partial [Stegodyphus mimosarum]